MQKEFYKSDTRGVAEHGWLSSRFSFSFAEYFDQERMGFGALRVLNDDKIDAGRGFGMHPHKDMEIITIPLEGQLMHKDSMGNEIIIKKCDVQVMSAGTGVTHSEMNPSNEDSAALLQIWITTRKNGISPAHDHATFDEKDQMGKFDVLVKPDTKSGEGLSIHQDAYISRGRFESGQSVTYNMHEKGNGAYVFMIDGTVTIDGQQLQSRDAVGISHADSFVITIEKPADVLVIEVPMR